MLTAEDLTFPHPEQSILDGLIAIGGDLRPERLLAAYKQGIFPWYETGQPILWWSPDTRSILIPESFKVSRSLRKKLKLPFSYTLDTAFSEVIAACASTGKRTNRTWITSEMRQAYYQLHWMGYAHSIEVWYEEKLVGGLYGVSLGRAFFGESMFHRKPDASKLSLFYLCDVLSRWKFDFIDCQLPTSHLGSLGAIKVARKEFLHSLDKTLMHPTRKGKWCD